MMKAEMRALHAPSWRGARSLLVGMVLATASACIYGDSRCSPGQELYDRNICVCPEGSTYTPTGCVTCGENQVVSGAGCACAPGFVQASPEADCEPAPMGLGADCVPGGAPCVDTAYSVCQPATSGGGYCTSSGCSSTADCEAGYACETDATPSFCRRPPTGLGQACASSADCAGTEALWCDTFMAQSCIVQDCSLTADDCFEGWDCCDLSSFQVPVPLCVPAGTCPT